MASGCDNECISPRTEDNLFVAYGYVTHGSNGPLWSLCTTLFLIYYHIFSLGGRCVTDDRLHTTTIFLALVRDLRPSEHTATTSPQQGREFVFHIRGKWSQNRGDCFTINVDQCPQPWLAYHEHLPLFNHHLPQLILKFAYVVIPDLSGPSIITSWLVSDGLNYIKPTYWYFINFHLCT